MKNTLVHLLRSLKLFLKCGNKIPPRLLFRVIKCRLLSRFGCLQLERIYICPSHECNADCVHCYEKFKHEKFGYFLTTKQIKNIIDQFHRMGGCSVVFCSGEFLIRNDALEIIRYIKDKGLLSYITTNGLLINENKIDELRAAGLTCLTVSIDSANSQRHNKLRGVNGCFEKAISAIRLAKDRKIITQVLTYITKSNYNELPDIVRLLRKIYVEKIFVLFPLLSGHLFNRPEENLNYHEREAFRKQFNNQPDVTLEFPNENSPCKGGGFRHINVMPSGDVTFCPCVPYSYGSIHSDSLKNCVRRMTEDYRRFKHFTGQCIVNFEEYRKECNAKFIYENETCKN